MMLYEDRFVEAGEDLRRSMDHLPLRSFVGLRRRNRTRLVVARTTLVAAVAGAVGFMIFGVLPSQETPPLLAGPVDPPVSTGFPFLVVEAEGWSLEQALVAEGSAHVEAAGPSGERVVMTVGAPEAVVDRAVGAQASTSGSLPVGSTVETASIRGQEASLYFNASGSMIAAMWTEATGEVVLVTISPVSREVGLAVIDGIRQVSSEEWSSMVGSAGTGDSPTAPVDSGDPGSP